MADCCGEICKLSDNNLIWKLHIKHNENEFLSPNFQLNGCFWYLKMSLFPKPNDLTSINLLINFKPSPGSYTCSPTFRMAIKDDKGDDYWSTLIKYKFSPENSIISRNFVAPGFIINKRCLAPGAPGVFLSIYLKSCTTTERPPSQRVGRNSGEDSFSCHTADVGTQTCSDLTSYSTSSEGIDKLLKDLEDLMLKAPKSDVTLKVRGTEFKAHKALLMSRSTVFEKMFDHEMLEETSGSVNIPDCEPEVFHAFLLYLYTGKVERPTVKGSVELYYLADKYNIQDLCRSCVQFLISNLTVGTFCAVVSLGLRHCESELMESTTSFFRKNMKQIVQTDNWKIFNNQNPDEATEIFKKALS